MAKQIKSLDDAQRAINDLYNQIELKRTKDWDFTGLRIKNAGDAVDPQDYVTLHQVPKINDNTNVDNDYKTIIFSKDGAVSDLENSPEYVVGKNCACQPVQVWVKCKEGFEPAGGDLVINVSYTRYDTSSGSPVTVNLLATDLHLPVNTSKPVYSSNFTTPIPKFAEGTVLDKIIVTGSNASFVSIGVVVQILNKVRG